MRSQCACVSSPLRRGSSNTPTEDVGYCYFGARQISRHSGAASRLCVFFSSSLPPILHLSLAPPKSIIFSFSG